MRKTGGDSPLWPDYSIVYALTERDMPLLLKAGFKSQGMYWDLMWGSDNTGVVWQASLDEGEYAKFYEHDKDLRRKKGRTMTRQEFLRRFGV